MSNIQSCLPASTFIEAKVNINDELLQEDLFVGFNILSDVSQDQVVGSDPFGITGSQPCHIKKYNSFTQVASDFRENSPTYNAAFTAFSVSSGSNSIYISNFPLSTMTVSNVENRFATIQRQNNNWGYIVLAHRAFYNETVGTSTTDTYTAFQNAIAQWVEDRREIDCEPKFFFAQTDDHRTMLASPYDGGLNENIVYDAFLAEYHYTMTFYHSTLTETSEVDSTAAIYQKIDSFSDSNKLVPVYSQDTLNNPIYFEFLDVSFAMYNISKDLNLPSSGYTAKFQSLDFVTPSLPKISQGHATQPGLQIGQWDSVSFADTTCAIATVTTGTLQGADVRTFMQILTGYLPKSQSSTNSYGYLGDADATQETSQFGRYGNAYVCHCSDGSIIEGTCASGRFWDVVHATDWINFQIQLILCERLNSANKIPISSEGISIITTDLTGVLATAQAAELIDEDLDNAPGFVVAPPAIEDVTNNHRRNRSLPCFNIGYRLSQGLHSVCVNAEATIFSEV